MPGVLRTTLLGPLKNVDFGPLNFDGHGSC